jgi:predicted phosphodiesterase
MLSRKDEKIFEYKIKTGRKNIRLWFSGDWHVGNEKCDIELLKKYLRWAKKNKDVYIILMGDLMESVIASEVHAKMMWTQNLTPDKQFDKITQMLLPLKDRIICAISGNHEDRISDFTGIDITEILCRDLGIKYLKGGDYLILNLNGIRYTLAIFHGSMSSISPDYQLKKALDIWVDADLIALGHIHQIFSKDSYVFTARNTIKSTRNRMAIRTGGFLEYPNYAAKKFFPPAAIGSPIVVFGTKKEFINIERFE